VYAVACEIGNIQYGGMMNIGFRPTVNGHTKTIEVNIFDFNNDIYGQRIRVKVRRFLRSEKKFAGLEALKEQLNADKQEAMK
jgi:riboflavin kinase/FMN adenylyltransferase